MKISSIKSNPRFSFLQKAAAIVFWLAVWQAVYWLTGQEILVVSPAQAFTRLFTLTGNLSFWAISLSSLGRILLGFLAALAVGVLLAALTCKFLLVHAIFQPAISVIKATPVASFIILALVWIRSGNVPAFISFLMVLPIVWANVSQGISSTDRQLLEVARLFRFRPMQTFRRVYLPSVLPSFMSAFTTGLGFAWKSGVAAEVIANTKNSIGGQIYESKIYLETADLFAWTIVVILLSVIFEKLLVWLMKKCAEKIRSYQ